MEERRAVRLCLAKLSAPSEGLPSRQCKGGSPTVVLILSFELPAIAWPLLIVLYFRVAAFSRPSYSIYWRRQCDFGSL